jgi:N-acetylmuramic acid 6-phosphate (MurNAc-6-P) etherase
MPFDRSRVVIENPNITKVQLWTGPQTIGGSTRMQASTSEQFVISVVLEEALIRALLAGGFSPEEMNEMGFEEGITRQTLRDRLLSFIPV